MRRRREASLMPKMTKYRGLSDWMSSTTTSPILTVMREPMQMMKKDQTPHTMASDVENDVNILTPTVTIMEYEM